MRLSQIISIFTLLFALSTGFALFTLDYVWASRAAGLWIVFYYAFLIINEHENKD